MDSAAIRVRMAPSPTGFLHIGTARTTLFNWLFARHHKGTFILRIEDTDETRSKTEHELGLIQNLRWLGLEWDEGPDARFENGKWEVGSRGAYGPYRQSERGASYRKCLERLLTEKKAYFCYCTPEESEAERKAQEEKGLVPKYSGRCRNLAAQPSDYAGTPIVRLKVPGIKVIFEDLVRGRVEFDAGLLGDFVIARGLDSVLFHFAVVVDDEEMKITHVIRGEDHLANTPKHILIQEALGFARPTYAHIPLVLNTERAKMSKRSNEASFDQYREQGYLPEAMLNFLALLGWHPTDDEEVLAPAELIAKFDLGRVQKAGAIFNREKLDWLNAQHLRRLPEDELVRRIRPFWPEERGVASEEMLRKIAILERERARTLLDFITNTAFIFALPPYEPELLVWKKSDLKTARRVLTVLSPILEAIPEADFERREALSLNLAPLLEEHGKGQILWPLRVALSGLAASPDPLDILGVLGKEESLRRVRQALQKLS